MAVNGDCYPNSTAIGTAFINDSLAGAIKISFNECTNTLSKTPIWSGSSLTPLSFGRTHALGVL